VKKIITFKFFSKFVKKKTSMQAIHTDILEQLFGIANGIAEKLEFMPNLVISSGSGLNNIWSNFEILQKINYNEIPYMPQSTVEGHSNEILIIRHNEKIAMVFAGRFHLYEGYPLEFVLIPLIIPYLFGVRNFVYLNAAGGLNPKFNVGDLMLLTSSINFTFKDIIHLFNKQFLKNKKIDDAIIKEQWRNSLENSLIQNSISYQNGTYIEVTGPSYETPAEARFFRRIKGDAIGMSTVLELLSGALLSVNQLGISFITNKLSENPKKKTNHLEVLDAISTNATKFTIAIKSAIESAPLN